MNEPIDPETLNLTDEDDDEDDEDDEAEGQEIEPGTPVDSDLPGSEGMPDEAGKSPSETPHEGVDDGVPDALILPPGPFDDDVV